MKSDIIQRLQENNIDKIKFAVTDIDGVLRGKIININKFVKAIENGVGFCNVVFGWDMNDVCYTNGDVSGWHTGYPDAFATIDLNTYRTIPWQNNIPFFLADFSHAPEVAAACPRTLLKHISEQCEALGFKAFFSKEFEWFNFTETPQTLSDKHYVNPQPLTPGMFGYSLLRTSQHEAFYYDLFNLLNAFDVPLEGLHTETGNGVYEASIDYTDILEAADRAVLFKTAVKEIAYKHGLMATFMAKWNSALPGCSGHIHQHLEDENGNNIFKDESDANGLSEIMKQYIAGQLYCLPFIMPMYAPTINSYKRYVEGAWAATGVSWGIENRTTALRVINHVPAATRLETRVPGADANPYLSMAASLASGLYGIKHKLSLNLDAVKGSAYDIKSLQRLPATLQEATLIMKNSNIAASLFGETFTDHFIRTREWECRQFEKQVTDWELKRYFEII
ncbi:glutamine synthetase family protein [Parafilimonas sp.]|uniref:glutamine synthetase family protein n=1 Tax=Parafilimonas sp. TaxID=1969739 RepID=UPI003F7F7BA6